MRSRDLGANGHGTTHWWQQRVSAIALAPLSIWLVVGLAYVPIDDRPSMVHWIRGGVHALLLVALILAAAQHSYLGTRVIVEDYVSRFKVRAVTVVMLQFTHVVLAGAGVLSVLRIALGTEP
jgi:succinate dehydrogenase / fumarate reductase, membrane anchor subunit